MDVEVMSRSRQKLAATSAGRVSEYVRQKQDRRRSRIMDAAATVFAEYGYFTATMKDIADRLEMRPSSLYHYLESKEAALESICREGGDDYCRQLGDILKNGGPAAAMVEKGIRLHLIPEMRNYVVNFAFNRRNLPTGIVDELNETARAYRRIWLRIFELGRRQSEWRSGLDSSLLADSVLALCNGLAASFVFKKQTEILRSVEMATIVFIRGILEP
jgi:TetR/AcrR family transcriptional regulator, cholesterol catabolism regulator